MSRTLAAGLFTVREGQLRLVRAGRTYTPDKVAASQYDGLYARYCRLDDLLAPWFHEADAPIVEEQGTPK